MRGPLLLRCYRPGAPSRNARREGRGGLQAATSKVVVLGRDGSPWAIKE